jgi:hypothetical protein
MMMRMRKERAWVAKILRVVVMMIVREVKEWTQMKIPKAVRRAHLRAVRRTSQMGVLTAQTEAAVMGAVTMSMTALRKTVASCQPSARGSRDSTT